jgi:hypothetical protein
VRSAEIRGYDIRRRISAIDRTRRQFWTWSVVEPAARVPDDPVL